MYSCSPRDRSLFLPEGAGSYQQNTSQNTLTPPFVETKKVMTPPPLGLTKKWWHPPPPRIYATIMIIPNNNTK